MTLEEAPVLDYRPMQATDEADVQALFGLLKQAEAYSILVEGVSPSFEDAVENLVEVPPGKTIEDKFFFGIHQAETLVGCVDLIRAYPDPDIAYLGLMLFAESSQGKGLGKHSLDHLIRLACDWGCRHMRLGVIETNVRGLRFWQREGFAEIYRKTLEGFTGDVIVMQKTIDNPV